ncbi:chitinase domain-containing protein 1 [Cladochytrium replicatum]|nr:chitinase domain-containing protein 1 [Cladochytrium replicatum]
MLAGQILAVWALAAGPCMGEQVVFGGGVASLSVFDRELVANYPSARSIITEHDSYDTKNAHKKSTKGSVLAYITPWNNHGYDIAKIFRGKFTHISPVWYTVRPNGESYVLHGSHDVDQPWISEVRGDPQVAHIVPRFQMDAWTQEDFVTLLIDQTPKGNAARSNLVSIIASEVTTQNFDGLVLESGAAFYMAPFLSALRAELGSSKTIVLVVPPSRGDGSQQLLSQAIPALEPLVDFFSLMTYDYSRPDDPGPNAPINWIEDNVDQLAQALPKDQRGMVLTGLNMYGVDYASGGRMEHVIGKSFLELLAKHTPRFEWDDETAEHSFTYMDDRGAQHQVYFPTLKSLDERIALAEELGTGLSLWELGQGLDYFYDLL